MILFALLVQPHPVSSALVWQSCQTTSGCLLCNAVNRTTTAFLLVKVSGGLVNVTRSEGLLQLVHDGMCQI